MCIAKFLYSYKDDSPENVDKLPVIERETSGYET